MKKTIFLGQIVAKVNEKNYLSLLAQVLLKVNENNFVYVWCTIQHILCRSHH